MTDPMTDATVRRVTRAVAAGDPTAFGEFYDHWFDWTYTLTHAMTRKDESFCLDVVQDAMLRAAASLRTLRSRADLERWLTRVVRSAAVDRIRSEQRRSRREESACREREISQATSALPALVAAERADWLAMRLTELPPVERRLLHARYSEGKTLTAAGQAVGLTGDAAHGRIRRALERLRIMAREVFDDDA